MTPTQPVGAGPLNAITDVAGIRVGCYERRDEDWLTGTTVVLAPEHCTGGVDVRGGAPGTRETDLLEPSNLVQHVNAVVLSGGSAYGLAAASGVMDALGAQHVGQRVGPGAHEVVPIVPAAVVFDLGRGGDFGARPDGSFGARALDAARGGAVEQGNVGAGTGALVGGLKGGLGTASVVLADGTTVAALAIVNAAGSAVDPRTGLLYGAGFGLDGEFDHLRAPSAAEIAELGRERTKRSLNTTIGVVATDATLDKAGCRRLAAVAHDGLARAIRPAHGMVDGDAIFALATGARPALTDAIPALLARESLLAAAADCFTRAIVHGVLAARSVGTLRAYGDVAPSAYGPPTA